MIVTLHPGALLTKRLSEKAVFDLPTDWWGDLPASTEVRVASVRPKGVQFNGLLRTLWLTPEQAAYEAMVGVDPRQKRVPFVLRGACLAIVGGVAGVRYEIALPSGSFQLRVTIDA